MPIKFNPSRDDIERICRFFAIGKPQDYKKEKGISFPHANPVVFVTTTRGQYALKFYPTGTAAAITIEYAINRLLIDHRFPTPIMYAGLDGQPFAKSNDRLTACYAYIDGLPVSKYIKQGDTIQQINASLLSLKNILPANKGRIPFPKHEGFTKTINTLTKISRTLAPYDQKGTIDASLLDACRTYKNHQTLFSLQLLHNQPTLTNFLIDKKTVYTLDLEHIQEDYALCDLASMVMSCLSFKIPTATIKSIVKDYFVQHQLDQGHLVALKALVKIGLIRAYLKNVQRDECPDGRKSIITLLKKMNDTPPGFIV